MADRLVDNKGGYGPTILLTGETTNSYVEILDLDGRPYMETHIILRNTHSSNDLKFKASYKETDYDDGDWVADIPETTLPAGEWTVLEYKGTWAEDFASVARIKVEVKAASAGSQATYRLKYRCNNKD